MLCVIFWLEPRDWLLQRAPKEALDALAGGLVKDHRPFWAPSDHFSAGHMFFGEVPPESLSFGDLLEEPGAEPRDIVSLLVCGLEGDMIGFPGFGDGVELDLAQRLNACGHHFVDQRFEVRSETTHQDD